LSSAVTTCPGVSVIGTPSRLPDSLVAQRTTPPLKSRDELVVPVALQAAVPHVWQSVPSSWNAAGGASLPALLPVNPMVTDADGAMIPS